MTLLMVILKLIIMIVVPVAVTVITYFGKKLVNKMISKIDDEKTKEAILQGQEIIMNAVECVQQTYVDELKKNDEFTLEAQKEALIKAKLTAIDLMNADVQNAIEDAYGDLDKYITTIIEGVVLANK